MSRTGKLFFETTGAEIAEAAVVMPLTFMLLLGIYWFGRAYNTYATITHAAREGARAAVAPSCALCGNTSPNAAAIANEVIQALQASKIDPGQIQLYTPNPAPTAGVCPGGLTSATSNNVTVYTNVQLNPGTTGPPACGVTVSFQYPYQFYFPFTSLNQQMIILKTEVQMASEE